MTSAEFQTPAPSSDLSVSMDGIIENLKFPFAAVTYYHQLKTAQICYFTVLEMRCLPWVGSTDFLLDCREAVISLLFQVLEISTIIGPWLVSL
jgi:hypothetical protein